MRCVVSVHTHTHTQHVKAFFDRWGIERPLASELDGGRVFSLARGKEEQEEDDEDEKEEDEDEDDEEGLSKVSELVGLMKHSVAQVRAHTQLLHSVFVQTEDEQQKNAIREEVAWIFVTLKGLFD